VASSVAHASLRTSLRRPAATTLMPIDDDDDDADDGTCQTMCCSCLSIESEFSSICPGDEAWHTVVPKSAHTSYAQASCCLVLWLRDECVLGASVD
jgi:hypothetical protein